MQNVAAVVCWMGLLLGKSKKVVARVGKVVVGAYNHLVVAYMVAVVARVGKVVVCSGKLVMVRRKRS